MRETLFSFALADYGLCNAFHDLLCELRSHVVQSLERELAGHLLAPVHHEISVVQRPRLYITGFGGRLNLIVVERFANQSLRSFINLDRRRRDASKNYLRSFYVKHPVATARVRSPTVRRATPTPVELNIRSLPLPV